MLHKNICNHSYHKNVNHSFVYMCNDGYVETLGNRIERLRKERNLSQQQVATAAGVSRVAVTKWENDRTKNLKKENLLALSDLFGLSIEDLISDVPNPLTAKQPRAHYEKPPISMLSSEETLILMAYRAKKRSDQLIVMKILDVEPEDFAQSA